jgi:hypothetical protein
LLVSNCLQKFVPCRASIDHDYVFGTETRFIGLVVRYIAGELNEISEIHWTGKVERNTARASSDRFTILIFRLYDPIHPNSNAQLSLAAVRTKHDIFRPTLAWGAAVITGIGIRTSLSVVTR